MLQYTKFELVWKDIFLTITMFVLFTKDIGFFWSLYWNPVGSWSIEQAWILLMLLGLLMFNDPFFWAQVSS